MIASLHSIQTELNARPPSSRNVAPEPTRWWSWAAAIGASFLALGLWNLTATQIPVVQLQIDRADTTEVLLDDSPPPTEDTPPDSIQPTTVEPEVIPEVQEFEMPALPEPIPVDPAPDIIDPLPPPPEPRPRAQPRPQPQPSQPAPSPAPATTTQPRTMDGAKGRFPQPPYPSFALSRGISGTVIVSVDVSQEGRPTQVKVSRTSGFAELDRHVTQWIQRRWRWDEGQAGRYTQPVIFQLQQ